MTPLRGVIPPICTPRTASGDLDVESTSRLCVAMIDAGVDGLFVAGSTGEAALIDEATRLAALDIAVEVAAGRVPVLAGAIDTGTPRVLEKARAAVEHGADAVVVTPPFYVGAHPDEVRRHFALLRKAIGRPLVAYHIPSATHAPFAPETVAAIARDGDVVALKDSSGDLTALRKVIALTAGLDFPVLTGSETAADVAVRCGAAGIVPGLGNVDARGYVALYDAAANDRMDEALRLQAELSALFEIVGVADRSRIGFTAGAIGSFKSALWHLGVIADPSTWPPFLPLSDAEHRAIADAVDAHFEQVGRSHEAA